MCSGELLGESVLSHSIFIMNKNAGIYVGGIEKHK